MSCCRIAVAASGSNSRSCISRTILKKNDGILAAVGCDTPFQAPHISNRS